MSARSGDGYENAQARKDKSEHASEPEDLRGADGHDWSRSPKGGVRVGLRDRNSKTRAVPDEGTAIYRRPTNGLGKPELKTDDSPPKGSLQTQHAVEKLDTGAKKVNIAN